jgi:hypothetical protein
MKYRHFMDLFFPKDKQNIGDLSKFHVLIRGTDLE